VIELMIAVALVAILAALAYPSFMDAVYKGRRSEAFSNLASLQLAQERYRANRTTYAASLTDLYASPQAPPSPSYYTLSVAEATATGYRLRAVAKGMQASDARCATMEVRAEGGTIQYGSSCSACTPATPLTDTNQCWSRQ
jgi:type IV pilus assembly protein PilE